MRRTVLVLVMVTAVVMTAVMMALSATAAPFAVGLRGSDISVVAVGGEERGGAPLDLA